MLAVRQNLTGHLTFTLRRRFASICHFMHPALEVRLTVLEMLGDPGTSPSPCPSETPFLPFRQKGRLHPLPTQCDALLSALIFELTLSRCIQPSKAVLRFAWSTLSRPTKSKGTQTVSLQCSTIPCVAHRGERTTAYVQAALIFVQLYSNASTRADQTYATQYPQNSSRATTAAGGNDVE